MENFISHWHKKKEKRRKNKANVSPGFVLLICSAALTLIGW